MTCSINNAADPPGGAASLGGMCRNRKDLVGECVKVRGRLRGYGTNPRCRIWPIGTAHLLGVVNPNALPSNVACGEDFEVYADFGVCPVEEPRPSGIQMVCLGSATNLRASELKHDETH
jgi:hypothetical protein